MAERRTPTRIAITHALFPHTKVPHESRSVFRVKRRQRLSVAMLYRKTTPVEPTGSRRL